MCWTDYPHAFFPTKAHGRDAGGDSNVPAAPNTKNNLTRLFILEQPHSNPIPHIYNPNDPHKNAVVLSVDPRQSSKIGTLILLSPQSVRFLSSASDSMYGLNFFVRKSV